MSVRGGSPGPSMTGSVRLLAVAAVLVGGGTPAGLAALQVLAAPEPPVRLAMLLTTSTHWSVLGLAAMLLGPFRGPLIAAGVVLAGLVVLGRIAGARSALAPGGGARVAGPAVTRSGSAGRSAVLRPGALSRSFHRSGRHPAGRLPADRPPAGRLRADRPATGRPPADRVPTDRPPASRLRADRPASGRLVAPACSVAGRPVVVVSAATGTVGRAALGGRTWTVRGTGGRLRDGHRYTVLARRGDVLQVAATGVAASGSTG